MSKTNGLRNYYTVDRTGNSRCRYGSTGFQAPGRDYEYEIRDGLKGNLLGYEWGTRKSEVLAAWQQREGGDDDVC